jgi:hypothetical protein
MKKYWQQYWQFPLPIPQGPCAELKVAYKELCLDVIPAPERERPANRWISDKSWKVIDQRATLRRMGNLPLAAAHRIGGKIKSSPAADRKQHAANAASTVESHLSNGSVKEAWGALKGWYWVAEDRPPPACPETMAKQMAKRVELYARAPPMGTSLPFNFPYFKIPDGVPTNKEIRAMVSGLKNGQVTGATGMRAEHVKTWLSDIPHEEKVAQENPGRIADMGDLGKKWRIFVEMIQVIRDRGETLMQMSWMVVVLLPVGKGNFRGIGLLNPCWKIVEKIMVRRMGAIDFHPCLHGEMPKRGTSTAMIEAKLAQQLAWVEQEPLYQVFVDLRKAYNHLNCAKCIEIMTGYGVGPKLLCLQEKFWEQAEIVAQGVVLANCLPPFGASLRVGRYPV